MQCACANILGSQGRQAVGAPSVFWEEKKRSCRPGGATRSRLLKHTQHTALAQLLQKDPMVQCTCTGASCSHCVPHKSPGPPTPPPAAPQPRRAMSPQSSNCCVNDTLRSPTAHPATGRSPVPTIQRPRAQLLSCHLFLCCLPPPLPPPCHHGHPSPPEDLLPATTQPHRFPGLSGTPAGALGRSHLLTTWLRPAGHPVPPPSDLSPLGTSSASLCCTPPMVGGGL